MSEKLTKEFIRHKIEWEGWPDALEWFAGDETEDPALTELIAQGLTHYIFLENLRKDIDNILLSEQEEDEE